jgi:hypothetical protein
MVSKRKPVPWIYVENGRFKNWTWSTPHLIVKVIGEGDVSEGGAVFNWQILEKKNGAEYIFEASTSRSFREAETEILEIIAKSWDKSFGYDEYAGPLATTYQIYGNQKLNVESFVGHNVSLKISDEGGESILSGVFGLKNYNFILRQKDNIVKIIPPLTVKEITF